MVKKRVILCNKFTLLCTVLTPFSLNNDVSYPMSHVTLTLDSVTSFQRIKNVINMLNFAIQSNGWRDFFSTMDDGGKVKETEGSK